MIIQTIVILLTFYLYEVFLFYVLYGEVVVNPMLFSPYMLKFIVDVIYYGISRAVSVGTFFGTYIVLLFKHGPVVMLSAVSENLDKYINSLK